MDAMNVGVCQCGRCRAEEEHSDRRLHEQMNLLMSRLDEGQRRWYAAVEATRLGHGGVRLVAQITGLDEKTIRRGQEEVAGSLADVPARLQIWWEGYAFAREPLPAWRLGHSPTPKLEGVELTARGRSLVGQYGCARCHSSKQPPPGTGDTAAWYRAAVQQPDFVAGNFLSNDRRYSVAELGTNIGRAIGSNAIQGHVWEEFSSQTYKDQPASAPLKDLYNPLKPSRPITFQPPGGGRGYYRVPTLAGVWATAPYLHNNSVGLFNADPSIAGRIAAFNDGIEKMLWPEKRPGKQSVWMTTEDSAVPLESGYKLKVRKGTPVALFANINAPELQLLRNDNFFTRFIGWLIGRGALTGVLLRNNLSPDFVVDRGHTFGSAISDADKRALIEFVRTF